MVYDQPRAIPQSPASVWPLILTILKADDNTVVHAVGESDAGHWAPFRELRKCQEPSVSQATEVEEAPRAPCDALSGLARTVQELWNGGGVTTCLAVLPMLLRRSHWRCRNHHEWVVLFRWANHAGGGDLSEMDRSSRFALSISSCTLSGTVLVNTL